MEEEEAQSQRTDLFSAQDIFPHASVAYAHHSTRRLQIIRRFFSFFNVLC